METEDLKKFKKNTAKLKYVTLKVYFKLSEISTIGLLLYKHIHSNMMATNICP